MCVSRDSQKAALEAWVHEYRGDFGIALTDVVGMDAFLRDFDLYFAKLFDGLRHDSGDPVCSRGIAPLRILKKSKNKTQNQILTFSDGLDLNKALEFYINILKVNKTSFGIGTNLTNDMGITPINIVLKIRWVQWAASCQIVGQPRQDYDQ